jgi:ATP-binding cassette subfamily F protein uup
VIKEYAGGYTDMINQREMAQKEEMELVAEANKKKMPEKKAKTKLSFQEQKQLERLQQLVEKLNAEIQSLHVVIDDPDGYLKDAQKFNDSLKRLDVAKAELAVAEEEWLTLEMLREELEG